MLSTYTSRAPGLSNRALAVLRLTLRSQSMPQSHPEKGLLRSISKYSPLPFSRFSSSATSGRPIQHSPNHSDPLAPNIPLSPLGLPLHPLPLPLPPSTTSTPITREALHRLHRLSALNPPPEGSAEEAELLEGLKALIGLMDAVKAVELPEGVDYSALLGRGVGELELDFSDSAEAPKPVDKSDTAPEGAKRDRELLAYATRRMGDYYASRLPPKLE